MPEPQGTTGAELRGLQAQIQQWRQEERLDMAAHHAENKAEMEAIRREMLALSAMMKTGYPDGDLDGHCRYHELVIKREEQREQFWRGLLLHIAKTSTWAMLAGVFIYLVPLIGANLKEWLRR